MPSVWAGLSRACSKAPGRHLFAWGPYFMEFDDRADAEMYHVAWVLAALGHTLRLKIWCMLVPYGSNGLSVESIAAQLAVPTSSLLFHLQQMTRAGVLWQHRLSHRTMYGVNRDVWDRSCDFINRRSPGEAIEAPF
jgi:ArsR family transcriptional regulator, arsenate/arsenite/antimonite-responsive transcriptional repressor